MTREERARETVAQAMASKHWAGLVREGKDDDWGVIKSREAIAACLAFADAEAAAMRERAAGVCDAYAEPTDTPNDFTDGFENAARKLARRIRALPATGEVGRG